MDNLKIKKNCKQDVIVNFVTEDLWAAIGDEILCASDFLEGKDLQKVEHAIDILKEFQELIEGLILASEEGVSHDGN